MSALSVNMRKQAVGLHAFILFSVAMVQTVISKQLLCYYTGVFRSSMPVNEVYNSKCSNIVLWSAMMNQDLTVSPYFSGNKEFASSLLAAKPVGSKTKLYLGVVIAYRNVELCSKAYSSSANAEKFGQSIYNYMTEIKFDGVVIDVCPPRNNQEQMNMEKLLEKLKTLLGSKELGMNVISNNNGQYPIAAMNKYLTWVNVDPHSMIKRQVSLETTTPDYRISTSMESWRKVGIIESKIIGGLPAYASLTLLNQNTLFYTYSYVCQYVKSGFVSPLNMDEQAVLVTNKTLISPTISSVKIATSFVSLFGGFYALILDYDDHSNLCGYGKFPLISSMRANLPDEGIIVPITSSTTKIPDKTTTTTLRTTTTAAPSGFTCEDTGMFPDDTDCHKYYQCDFAEGDPTHSTCPTGQKFDRTSSTCVAGNC